MRFLLVTDESNSIEEAHLLILSTLEKRKTKTIQSTAANA